MSEQSPNIEFVYQRLDNLEREIHQLRESLRSQMPSVPNPEVDIHPYIEKLDSVLSGEPVITGTRIPVRAIVEYWKFGDSPEAIQQRLPYLRIAQIFAALSLTMLD